jgi:hypothetical protein
MSDVDFTRAPAEALIRSMMGCDDGEGVCEVCGVVQERKRLTTTWIGQGNSEEGIDLCRDCKNKEEA